MVKSNRVNFLDSATVLMFVILANLAAQSIFGFVLAIIDKLYAGSNILENTYAQLLGMMLIQCFYVGVIAIYFAVIKKSKFKLDNSIKNKISPISILIMVIMGIISVFCFYLPAAFFDNFLTFIGFNGSAGLNLDTLPQMILGVIVVCVLAPVLEEYIFRGFLLNGFKERFGTVAAVALSALTFSLAHMNPQQTVYQFFLGAVCAFATISSGNICIAIGIHSISNIIALLLDFTPLGVWFTAIMNTLTSTWWLSVISTLSLVAGGCALLFLLGKLLKKFRQTNVEKLPLAPPFAMGGGNANELAEKRKDKLAKKFLVIAICVCALMWTFVFIGGMII